MGVVLLLLLLEGLNENEKSYPLEERAFMLYDDKCSKSFNYFNFPCMIRLRRKQNELYCMVMTSFVSLLVCV